jgi:single-stranded-DNA-specific exonuclease
MAQNDKELFLKLEKFGGRIAESSRAHENMLVVCHHDADGIGSAVLVSQFVFKNGGHCEIRAVSEPSSRNLQKISAGNFDLVIFLDLASGLSKEIGKQLGDRWMVVDHHYIPSEEIEGESAQRIVNPWQFGFDGSRDVSTTGLIHFLVRQNRPELSYFLALVGAIADGQDVGPKRSLVGLNSKIFEDSKEFGPGIESKVDLLLYGRDTRAVHEAVANTTTTFIPGLTGNKDACLATLRSAGVELRLNSRWKTISDFPEDEKQNILRAILPHLSGTSGNVEDLVGTVYSLNTVDEFSLMHDARDLASTLSSCGRSGKSGEAIKICLQKALDLPVEVDKIMSDYRSELVRAIQTLSSSADRILDRGSYSLIVGDGIVGEKMTGAICQALASFNRSKNKVVFLRTTTLDGDVKVSARLGKGCETNLGQLLQSVAAATDGVGGGLSDKGGARFSIAKQQEFQLAVDEQFQGLKPKPTLS